MSHRNRTPSAGNSFGGSGRSTGGASTNRGALPSFYTGGQGNQPKPRMGPNRTSKATGKLKILPSEPESRAAPRGRKGHGDDDASEDDPDSDEDEDEDDDEAATVHKQLSQIPEGSMRRDARRLTKKARANLPRVTAYSTATSYRMRELTRWLAARRTSHRTNVMTFDECVYTTYTYEDADDARGLSSHPHGVYGGAHTPHSQREREREIRREEKEREKEKERSSGGGDEHGNRYSRTGDLLGIPELANEGEGDEETGAPNGGSGSTVDGAASSATLVDTSKSGDKDDDDEERLERERRERRRRRHERFSVQGMLPEVFFMEYGTVVIWGMTLAQEKRLLREIRRFEVEKLAPDDIESEDLNWYLADYSRIYNDVITLRRGSSYMTKLSLSHALAQSTKISFFEGVIDNTIETTKDVPQSIAETGKVGMAPGDIMKQIGHLFILRMNIHLVGSIVDSPEIFWAQPDLEPLYAAARAYLEIPQRLDLLSARVEVLQDLLQLLKDQHASVHSEGLEWLVIGLIGLEILLGLATMVVDIYAS